MNGLEPDFQALINEILNSESFQNRDLFILKVLDLYSKHLKKKLTSLNMEVDTPGVVV